MHPQLFGVLTQFSILYLATAAIESWNEDETLWSDHHPTCRPYTYVKAGRCWWIVGYRCYARRTPFFFLAPKPLSIYCLVVLFIVSY